MIWVVVGLLVVLFGGIALWLRGAPEGYEDEHGFHYGSGDHVDG
jgi:multisubunit Na+/H+ antiporter MnhB subunit